MTKGYSHLPLDGFGILITRPIRQAERLAKSIETAGGKPIIFPTIEIQAIEDKTPLLKIIQNLKDYDLVIFISANAVEQGMPYIVESNIPLASLKFAAIGNATKKALESYNVKDVIAPSERFDSEALLELSELQNVASKKIVIFRGETGRETLATKLRERGAHVDYAACYRRVIPSIDAQSLGTSWKNGEINAVSTMSLESLSNLCDILDSSTRHLLFNTPVFVPHPRIASGAEKMGLLNLHITGTTDEDLIKDLSQYHAR